MKLYKKNAKIKREVITNHFDAYLEKKYPPEKEPKMRPKYINEPIIPSSAFVILFLFFISVVPAGIAPLSKLIKIFINNIKI